MMKHYEQMTGSGVDAKFGVIVRPFEESPLRLGLSVTTPTLYSLETNSRLHMSSPYEHTEKTSNTYYDYTENQVFTFGWGYHTTNFYFDAALLYQRQSAEFYPFHYNRDITSAVNEVPGYELNLRRATCTFTLGFRF